MKDTERLAELESRLNSFDPAERREALEKLIADKHASAPEGTNVNMHFHSFFSYNAEGYSPSRIAWEARKAGLYAAGLCDFDVIDGIEEFIRAGLALKLRVTVNLETRSYIREYADVDITSPGEPGVTYVMGAGFARQLAPASAQARDLAGYRERARQRNVALMNRVNARLPEIAIDYEKDVLPLTPTGSATERHIITAYVNKSRQAPRSADETARFWSKNLGKTFEETAALLVDTPNLEELVRAKLVKKGGVGYEQPSPTTFPPVDEFMKWVASCGAIPMMTWLDGTSGGEKDGKAMLDCLRAKGAAAINIIPDRNWNVKDSAQRAARTAKLDEIVRIADAADVPLNIGTEMNKLGLPFVDNLDVPALKPHKESFLRGARIIVGHTQLLRYAGVSYVGKKAEAEFGSLKAKNAFFEKIGKLPPMDTELAGRLEDMGEEKAFEWFRKRAKETA